mmetsp:Transcript_20512/g.38378  ORF Transcript_20512/g.38378 Transcript_20512/m.38378 type:complete len:216 (-) Transcript_20512:847-1494(-)
MTVKVLLVLLLLLVPKGTNPDYSVATSHRCASCPWGPRLNFFSNCCSSFLSCASFRSVVNHDVVDGDGVAAWTRCECKLSTTSKYANRASNVASRLVGSATSSTSCCWTGRGNRDKPKEDFFKRNMAANRAYDDILNSTMGDETNRSNNHCVVLLYSLSDPTALYNFIAAVVEVSRSRWLFASNFGNTKAIEVKMAACNLDCGVRVRSHHASRKV